MTNYLFYIRNTKFAVTSKLGKVETYCEGFSFIKSHGKFRHYIFVIKKHMYTKSGRMLAYNGKLPTIKSNYLLLAWSHDELNTLHLDFHQTNSCQILSTYREGFQFIKVIYPLSMYSDEIT